MTVLTAQFAQGKGCECLQFVHQENGQSTPLTLKEPSSKVRIWSVQYLWDLQRSPNQQNRATAKMRVWTGRSSWYCYLKIYKELCKLGSRPSKLDQGIFYFYNRIEMIGTISLFVDDLLWAGNSELLQIIQKLKTIFQVG